MNRAWTGTPRGLAVAAAGGRASGGQRTTPGSMGVNTQEKLEFLVETIGDLQDAEAEIRQRGTLARRQVFLREG